MEDWPLYATRQLLQLIRTSHVCHFWERKGEVEATKIWSVPRERVPKQDHFPHFKVSPWISFGSWEQAPGSIRNDSKAIYSYLRYKLRWPRCISEKKGALSSLVCVQGAKDSGQNAAKKNAAATDPALRSQLLSELDIFNDRTKSSATPTDSPDKEAATKGINTIV